MHNPFYTIFDSIWSYPKLFIKVCTKFRIFCIVLHLLDAYVPLRAITYLPFSSYLIIKSISPCLLFRPFYSRSEISSISWAQLVRHLKPDLTG